MAGSVVICGAGIAGIAAAYSLTEHGVTNVMLVEPGNPLSLTSDKSTEAYRNWWPGPDRAMTAFMNRSIDLIEGIARATGQPHQPEPARLCVRDRGCGKNPVPADDGADRRGARRRSGALSRHGVERLHAVARARLRCPAHRRGRHHRCEPDPPALPVSRARDGGGRACAPRRLAQRAAARHDDAGGGARARREAPPRHGRRHRAANACARCMSSTTASAARSMPRIWCSPQDRCRRRWRS